MPLKIFIFFGILPLAILSKREPARIKPSNELHFILEFWVNLEGNEQSHTDLQFLHIFKACTCQTTHNTALANWPAGQLVM